MNQHLGAVEVMRLCDVIQKSVEDDASQRDSWGIVNRYVTKQKRGRGKKIENKWPDNGGKPDDGTLALGKKGFF